MSKKRQPQNDIPADAPEAVVDALTPPEADTPDTEPEVEFVPEKVEIEVPLGREEEGYLKRHLDVQLSSDRQRTNLRRLLSGLRDAGEKTEAGRLVANSADAVRWLLEQLG